MIRKTEIEVQKAAILKAVRAEIRLRHSIAADAEIAETLPEVEERINTAIEEGKPFELELKAITR